MEKEIFDANYHLSEEEIAKLEQSNKKEKEKKKIVETKQKEKIKDGYLLVINHQFFTPKQGSANNNVMTIQEVNELRKILQKILQTADPTGYENGLTYIKTSNVIVEFVHTSNLEYLSEMEPSPIPMHMNPRMPSTKFNPFSNEAAPFAAPSDLFKTQLTPFATAMPMSCIGCCNESCLFKKMYKNGNNMAQCLYAKYANNNDKKEDK